eukprot:jgi/Galph1/1310/GphlegSOOS_G5961.1
MEKYPLSNYLADSFASKHELEESTELSRESTREYSWGEMCSFNADEVPYGDPVKVATEPVDDSQFAGTKGTLQVNEEEQVPCKFQKSSYGRSSRAKSSRSYARPSDSFSDVSDGSYSSPSYNSFLEEEVSSSPSSSDDDYVFQSSRRHKKGTSRKKKGRYVNSGHQSNHSVYIIDDIDDSFFKKDSKETVDSSDEDEEWSLRNTSKKATGKKPKRRIAKSIRDSSDEYEQSRISLRMLGREMINYAEEDSDVEENSSDYNERSNSRAKFDNNDEVLDATERVVCHAMKPQDMSLLENDLVEEGEIPFSNIEEEFDPEVVYFAIKWRGRSYRRCTWHLLEELKHYKGFKKVQNYIKKIYQVRELLASPYVAPEDKEEELLRMEMEKNLLREHTKVERIVAQREVVVKTEPFNEMQHKVEYLVKWCGLPFIESTWESMESLSSEEDMAAIDAFLEREQAASSTISSRFNPFGTKASRKPFKRVTTQPSWLHGQGRMLRDYQLEGVNWLAFSWCHNRNVILADEMGLGKTLQTIAFLGWLRHEKNVPGPFLIVVPLSTITSWQREFSMWLPDFNVVLYVGDSKSREMIRNYEWFSPHNKKQCKFHVLITTPEMILSDLEYFSAIRWAILAVDEAHRLKNEASALHHSLGSLVSANRVLITGTPLQNSIRELWALLNFLHPEKYVSATEFEEKYDFEALRKPENITNLHCELRPYILRRQKADVERSLPRKTYAVLRVGLGPLQAQYYRWILTKNFAMLNAGLKEKGGHATTLLNIVMELKKCCNHPYLFEGVEDSNSVDPLQSLIKASGKLILLDKLLLRLKERGHRVLIFSQMVRMLDILQDYCKMRGFTFQRLDGSMPNHLRQRAVDHFNAPDSQDFVFLLSTRAGGLGINLATADTVIIFDSDWNPQNDLQAESRAHRIGQTKEVKVFRLLSKNTVEEDILERAKRKRVLEHLVISGVEGDASNNARVTFKKEELSAILRFGAEELFRDENAADEAAAADAHRLEMDDIDEIIARAAPEDTTDGAPGGTLGDSLLNAFKWADFAVDEEDTETSDIPESKISLESEQAAASAVAERLGQAAGDEKDETLRKIKQADEVDKELLKENDNEFWKRVIPDHLKEGAIAEELFVTPRKRSRTLSKDTQEVNTSSTGKRRPKRKVTNSAVNSATNNSSVSKRDLKSLLRSFKKFGLIDAVEQVTHDAGLNGKISSEQATDILSSLLEQAKEAVRKSENSHDVKKKLISVDFAGEAVNAEELLRRCKEMELLSRKLSQYEDPYRFRFRYPLKSASFDIRWGPVEDAMLLVGIYKYGFGNWNQIKADPSLRLKDKINTGEKEDAKQAPDASKLQRRATILLKALEKETEQAESKKARALKANQGSNGTSLQQASASKPNSHVLSRELCRRESYTLSELRKLSQMDNSEHVLDPKERAEKTKSCLLCLGNRIEEITSEDDVVIKEKLWKFIANIARQPRMNDQSNEAINGHSNFTHPRNVVGQFILGVWALRAKTSKEWIIVKRKNAKLKRIQNGGNHSCFLFEPFIERKYCTCYTSEDETVTVSSSSSTGTTNPNLYGNVHKFVFRPRQLPVTLHFCEHETTTDDNHGKGYVCPVGGIYFIGCDELVYIWQYSELFDGKVQDYFTLSPLNSHILTGAHLTIQVCQEKLSSCLFQTEYLLETCSSLYENLCHLFYLLFESSSENRLAVKNIQTLQEAEYCGLSSLLIDVACLALSITCAHSNDDSTKVAKLDQFGIFRHATHSAVWKHADFSSSEDGKDRMTKEHITWSNKLFYLTCIIASELIACELNMKQYANCVSLVLLGTLPLFSWTLQHHCLESLCRASKLPVISSSVDNFGRRDWIMTLSFLLQDFSRFPHNILASLLNSLYCLGSQNHFQPLMNQFHISTILKNIAAYAKQVLDASLAACASIVCEYTLNNFEDSFGFIVQPDKVREQNIELLNLSTYHRSLASFCQLKQPTASSNGYSFYQQFLLAVEEERKSLGLRNVIKFSSTEKKADLGKWQELLRDARKWNNLLQSRTKMVRRLVKYGIPMQIRPVVWKRLLGTDHLLMKYGGIFERLVKVKIRKEIDDIIERDVSRTLCLHQVFWSHGAAPGVDSLRLILQAYAALVPEVGYCQGMSSIAALILLFSCDVEEAFLNFVYVMDTMDFHDLFYPGFVVLKSRVAQFHGLAMSFFPDLMKRLAVEGTHPMMFADKWFLTAFVYNFPFPLVVRLWDIMIAYNHSKIILRAGLAILQIGKEKMMQMHFEELIQFVQRDFADPRNGIVDDLDRFIETAMTFRFKRKQAAKFARLSDIMDEVTSEPTLLAACFPTSQTTRRAHNRPLGLLEKWKRREQ